MMHHLILDGVISQTKHSLMVCLVWGVNICFHKIYIMSSSHKFWWNQLIPRVYINYYLMRNEVGDVSNHSILQTK
jgi:hypothetical protein